MTTLEVIRSLGLTTAELEKLVNRNTTRLLNGRLSPKAHEAARNTLDALVSELNRRTGH